MRKGQSRIRRIAEEMLKVWPESLLQYKIHIWAGKPNPAELHDIMAYFYLLQLSGQSSLSRSHLNNPDLFVCSGAEGMFHPQLLMPFLTRWPWKSSWANPEKDECLQRVCSVGKLRKSSVWYLYSDFILVTMDMQTDPCVPANICTFLWVCFRFLFGTRGVCVYAGHLVFVGSLLH